MNHFTTVLFSVCSVGVKSCYNKHARDVIVSQFP